MAVPLTHMLRLNIQTLVRYNGDYKFYMDSNERLAQKVESRYFSGGAVIESCVELEKEEKVDNKKKNFGGIGVTSEKEDHVIKNAKRMN